MRRAGWALLVLLLLLAIALVFVAREASRIASSDEARADILGRARALVGRDVDYAEASVTLLPPSVRVSDLRVAGPAPGEPDLLEAPSFEAQLALLPLLRGRIVVDEFVVRGPTLRLTLDERGLALGLPELPERSGESGPEIVARTLRIVGARIELDDRLREPAVARVLDEVDAELALDDPDIPLALEFSLHDAGGGRASGSGTLSLAGELDVALRLDGYPLGLIGRYVEFGELEGRATGRAEYRGFSTSADALDVALELADGRFALGDLEIVGPFELIAAIVDGSTGPFAIEAGAADVVWAGLLAKPPGRPGRVEGLLRRTPDGLHVDDVSLQLDPYDAVGSARLSEPAELVLSGGIALAEGRVPFDLSARKAAEAWEIGLRSQLEDVWIEGLLEALGKTGFPLRGNLALDFDVQGRAAKGVPFRRTLGGDVALRIAPGETLGISIVGATMRALDRAIGAGLLSKLRIPGRERSAGDGFASYETDSFESLSATLAIVEGVARTHDFRVVAPSFTFTMQGAIRLDDLGLDARGELRLGGQLSQAFARRIGLERLPVMRELVIPIPRLGGSLADPDPQPDFSVVVRLLTENLPGVQGAGKLLRGVGDLVDPR